MEGVSTITSIGEMSARVHMKDNSDEPTSYRRIGSDRNWSVSRRPVDTGASAGQSGLVRTPGPWESSEAKLPMPDRLDVEVSSAEPIVGKARDTIVGDDA